MVVCDETNLNLSATSSHEYEISKSNLDFSTIDIYIQPFIFDESANI